MEVCKHRFNPKNLRKEVLYWASLYIVDDRDVEAAGVRMRMDGFLTKPDLLMLAYWKFDGYWTNKREADLRSNSDELVREVTGIAITANCEESRLNVLTFIKGVQWPMASVILHLGHRDRYPILDVNALYSVNGTDVWEPKYKAGKFDFADWLKYVECCRGLADRAGVSMRTLDRALYQLGKGRKGGGGTGANPSP
jgi:hypothetical protein